jgi:hypothetical protein
VGKWEGVGGRVGVGKGGREERGEGNMKAGAGGGGLG